MAYHFESVHHLYARAGGLYAIAGGRLNGQDLAIGVFQPLQLLNILWQA